jgi:hypothetical protein
MITVDQTPSKAGRCRPGCRRPGQIGPAVAHAHDWRTNKMKD